MNNIISCKDIIIYAKETKIKDCKKKIKNQVKRGKMQPANAVLMAVVGERKKERKTQENYRAGEEDCNGKVGVVAQSCV